MIRNLLLYTGVALVALALGLGVARWMQGAKPVADADPAAVQALLNLKLNDLEQRPHALTQHRGKVLVVNYWATWCPPCREEIPHFVAMQQSHGARGVQFIGIALDDPVQVQAYAGEMNMNYPVLIGGSAESEAMRQLGNPQAGLPYTLVFDREGQLRESVLGGVDAARLNKLVEPYL